MGKKQLFSFANHDHFKDAKINARLLYRFTYDSRDSVIITNQLDQLDGSIRPSPPSSSPVGT